MKTELAALVSHPKCQLTYLDLHSSQASPLDLIGLLEAIKDNKTIQSFTISINKIKLSISVVESIAKCLGSNTALEKFHFLTCLSSILYKANARNLASKLTYILENSSSVLSDVYLSIGGEDIPVQPMDHPWNPRTSIIHPKSLLLSLVNFVCLLFNLWCSDLNNAEFFDITVRSVWNYPFNLNSWVPFGTQSIFHFGEIFAPTTTMSSNYTVSVNNSYELGIQEVYRIKPTTWLERIKVMLSSVSRLSLMTHSKCSNAPTRILASSVSS